MQLTAKAKGLKGTIRVAPDKSISHRALIFAALADGTSHIRNLLEGEDVQNTQKILEQLGVSFSFGPGCLSPTDVLRVRGLGLRGLKNTDQVLFCGNSGTTMRLMLGVLSGCNLAASLTGDASLNGRPMDRIINPLTQMGGSFQIVEEKIGRLVKTQNHPGLKSLHYLSPVASAQVKSSVLLAGLCAGVEVSVTEPHLSRNHTELMLQGMGAPVAVTGTTVTLKPVSRLAAMDFDVPGDISSAAFFMVAGLLCPESEIIIQNVNLNPTRTGILDVLVQMGGHITIENQQVMCGEPAGDLRVRTSKLTNVNVGGAIIPRLIDEIPILTLAAACADGEFVLSGARELRVKETDRLRAVGTEFKKLGVDIKEREDGLMIRGGRPLVAMSDQVCSYGDHRMAMMLSVAGLLVDQSLKIDDVDCINTSFPGFYDVLKKIR